jgi:predicted transcriptional regulator of viral defense system
MSAAATYTRLRRLGTRVLTTGEASAALRTSQSAASRSLRDLEAKGLARRVRFGLWVVGDEPVNPHALVGELTRPFPGYVSFASALAVHGAIDQIPREIAVASLGKARRIATTFGTYAVHRLPPELFGGFTEQDSVALATVEKAIFDYFYVASASGHPQRRLTELDLPAGFSNKDLDGWIARIHSPRLRTLVRTAVAHALEHGEREERRPASKTRARRAS